MTINEMTKMVHDAARSKGWWDNPRSPLELHMLMVSEIAEASEEVRSANAPIWANITIPELAVKYKSTKTVDPVAIGSYGLKPEGELIELADTVIRIMDYCGANGWDLEAAIQLKHKYNLTRSHRHGGKKY